MSSKDEENEEANGGWGILVAIIIIAAISYFFVDNGPVDNRVAVLKKEKYSKNANLPRAVDTSSSRDPETIQIGTQGNYAAICNRCNGTGKVRCDECNGTGTIVPMAVTIQGGKLNGPKQCWKCDGTGQMVCPVCGGSGHLQ